MDAELEEHRRLRRAFKCYVEPCFNEHWRSSHRGIQMRAGEAVRAAPTSGREALRNANVCGEFLFRVAWDVNGRGSASRLKTLPVTRATTREGKITPVQP